MNNKIAIIGASSGQIPLLKKAKELGIYTICFAWEEGAVGKDIPDKFYPISIFDYDSILEICKKEKIIGITSNASGKTAESVSFLATKLRLNGINYSNFLKSKDKIWVREQTNQITGLSKIPVYTKNEFLSLSSFSFPYIVKPTKGEGKKGVHFLEERKDVEKAVEYAINASDNHEITIEKYIEGNEISVETLSYHQNHYIIQITDKVNSGPPHFVELEHHQPSLIDTITKEKIKILIPKILSKLNINNCACHLELKIDKNDIYLIEVNMRGGGDEISNQLIYLSTGFDFLRSLILIAINKFDPLEIKNEGDFSGIYYLCKQTERLKKSFFCHNDIKPQWLIEKIVTDPVLKEGTSNYDRNGYLIYKSDKKIYLL